MQINDIEILRKIVAPRQIINAGRFAGVSGFSLDSRTIKRGEVFFAVKGTHCDGHDFMAAAAEKGAALIVAEHYPVTITVPVMVVNDAMAALKAVCAWLRREKNPRVFAVTGSVGKTTTKEMLHFLLQGQGAVCKNYKTENNLFGVAKTILSLKDEKILVMEVGTNAPGEIRELAEIVYPDVGVITFIKPVHLEKLKSLPGILREKSDLLRVNPAVTAVLNRDDRYLRAIDFCRDIRWYGVKKHDGLWARPVKGVSSFLVNGKLPLTLKTPMADFIYNALAALQAAMVGGVSLEDGVARLNAFDAFGDGRLAREKIGELLVVNDAYNANPYAVARSLAALKSYPQKKIVVLGDMLELGPRSPLYHSGLSRDIIKNDIAYCLLLGEAMRALEKRLKACGYKNVVHFDSHEEAARFAQKLTAGAPGDYLLFLKGSRRMQLEKIAQFLRD